MRISKCNEQLTFKFSGATKERKVLKVVSCKRSKIT